ncbi:hypothetical protein J26TS2_44920 [Shouchella clausii]|nr:hypothetical protein J26TS2_44920 [Shouchella clausii]
MVNLLGDKQEIVLKAIDRFGVITARQLSEFLKGSVSHVTVYTAKEKLQKLGFIEMEKHGRNLILYMRPTGVEYLGSSLTPFRNINYSQLKHQLTMIECILGLKRFKEKKGERFDFRTERELRSHYLATNFNKSQRRNTTLLKSIPDRIPDFLVIEGDRKIAHEVELTQKSQKRYVRKMNMYHTELMNGRYQKVRYMCESDHIKRVVANIAKSEAFTPEHLELMLVKQVVNIERN